GAFDLDCDAVGGDDRREQFALRRVGLVGDHARVRAAAREPDGVVAVGGADVDDPRGPRADHVLDRGLQLALVDPEQLRHQRVRPRVGVNQPRERPAADLQPVPGDEPAPRRRARAAPCAPRQRPSARGYARPSTRRASAWANRRIRRSLDSSAVRLTAGGPHFYALRPDSTVGGEVYERELLARLPAHGIDVLRRQRAIHWVLAPFVYTPYVIGLARRVDLL